MTADATDNENGQKAFPFMGLPPELRIAVYEFVLRDVTDPFVFPATSEAQEAQPCKEALSLLHKSKHMRQESCRAMRPLAERFSKDLNAVFEVVYERSPARASVQYASPVYEQARNEFDRASSQTVCISAKINALIDAERADLDNCRASLRGKWRHIYETSE